LEKGFMYSNGTLRFTCIGMSSLEGRRMLILMHVKRTIATTTVRMTVFLKMNSRVPNMQKISKIKNLYINLGKVHFFGLYFIIILQCTVQKHNT